MPTAANTLLTESADDAAPGEHLQRRQGRWQPGLGTVIVAIGALVAGLTLVFALAQVGGGPPSGNVPVSSVTGTSTTAQGSDPGVMVMIGSSPATDANDGEVSFVPTSVTIRAGQTVEWRWDDSSVPQNVTFAAGFHSATQTSGTYSHTFETPGVYPYSSTIHFGTSGEVIVR
jgi:plastocyanin